MKNGIVLILCLIFIQSAGFSQNAQLVIAGSKGKFYLDHSVAAKENWYSIGRLYNLPPHDIAAYNNLPFDKPLEIAQPLHIPLTATNFDQKQSKASGETLVPVYHVVQDKEWMYRISSIYNDVAVSSLEKWNKLKTDQVKPGISLIVGYLKVKTDLSPLAMGVSSNPATANTSSSATQTIPNTVKTSNASSQTSIGTVKTADISSQSAQTSTNIVKPAGSGTTTSTTLYPSAPATNNSTTDRVNNYAITHSNGGFFSIDYSGGGKSASGQAGTFKSTSGWTDGKYYALMNGVAVGTIVRVTGNNGKTIYAKVLGQLPDMKESNGLVARISNAASAELGLGERKFPVEIKY